MLTGMGSIFGEKLRQHREAKGVSGYRITQISGIPNPTLIAIEKGRRPPSDANLEALAGVPDLALTLDELKAWRDLDKIGEEGIERIKRYAPEVFLTVTTTNSIAKKEGDADDEESASNIIGQVMAEIPDDMRYPPTSRELKLLARIGGFGNPELDPRSGSPLWLVPPEERWAELKEAEKALQGSRNVTQNFRQR